MGDSSDEILREIPEEDRELAASVDPKNILSPTKQVELARKLKEMAEAKEFHGPSPSWFIKY